MIIITQRLFVHSSSNGPCLNLSYSPHLKSVGQWPIFFFNSVQHGDLILNLKLTRSCLSLGAEYYQQYVISPGGGNRALLTEVITEAGKGFFFKHCNIHKNDLSDMRYLLSLCAHRVTNHAGPVGGS